LLIAWGVITLRIRATPRNAWLALASIAALSMLPVYHRQYDAKLLLLTLPACVLLWAEGGRLGKVALLINTAALILTGDLTWAILLGIIDRLHVSANGLSGFLLVAAQMFPAPLILLATAVFYLWIYARQGFNGAPQPNRLNP
jgi:hypothetical protein